MQMHCKGSRHLAAKSKAKEKELARRNEINKRLALEGSSTTSSINSGTTKQNARLPSKSKPLIQMAQKAASEILGNKRLEVDSRNENHNTVVPRQNDVKNATLGFSRDHNCSNETSHKLIQNHLDFRECRERELKFTSAGWKRDCHGKWLNLTRMKKIQTHHFDRRSRRFQPRSTTRGRGMQNLALVSLQDPD
ncbi:hypothetical protein Golax_011160 [Gossypium laxum]|uniref:Uncharacterized protein n=1 Tax=Gossypium laxum TaxID=34288 RepID=A0A7J8ZK13_9ROSI|nr:hypothetical protein [Gossypium laxum]